MEERYQQRASTPVLQPQFRQERFRESSRVTLRFRTISWYSPEGSERYISVSGTYSRPTAEPRARPGGKAGRSSFSTARRIRGPTGCREILTDSARYNVGDVERNINTPTMALLFLSSAYKDRFEFRRGTDASTSLRMDAPDRGLGLWVVDYEETGAITVIRGRDDQRLPVRGRYWIEPSTGRVFLSELVLDADSLEALITVRYEANDTLGHFVPVEMRERFRNLLSGSLVEGTATYTRFRRFRVLVEESAPFRN